MLKSALHAHRLVGTDKIPKPQPNWTDEQWQKYYDDAGLRPKDAATYRRPENIPEAAKLSEDNFLKPFYEIAHKEGLTDRQAAAFVRAFAEFKVKGDEHFGQLMEQQRQQDVAALQKEWGLAFPEQIKLAQEAAKRFGGDEALQLLAQSPLGNSPVVLKLLANVGKAVSDDVIVGRGTPQTTFTPAQAQQEIAKLSLDQKFSAAYASEWDPGHADAVKRMTELHEMAYPRKAG